jgi:glycosyltransferase involved in cell wall biosynthesis
MKIAIISSGFLPVVDGVNLTVFNRLQKLSEWGHQVLLFCPDYSPLAKIYPDWQNYAGNILPGVQVVNLPSTPLLDLDFDRNVSRKSYKIVIDRLQEFQPDIVHVDEPERLFAGFWRIPGVNYAKSAGIPCVSFFHSNFLEYGKYYFGTPAVIDALIKFILKFALRWIYNAYDATLVSSSFTYDKVRKMGIKNALYGDFLGLDLAKFSPNLREEGFFQHKYGLSGVDRLVKLVFLGRLTPDKGWNFTLDALPKLLAQVNPENIAIIVAGDGSLREQIAQKLSKLTPNAHLIGRIPGDDVPALLANSDIHVTASETETKGLTVLEAFAAGIPVIAPNAGGVRDSIRDGENGFLFKAGDRSDFVNKLKVLINNPTLRQTMGNKGKEDAKHLSLANSVENLLQVWEECRTIIPM